jgi:hypothetical protein
MSIRSPATSIAANQSIRSTTHPPFVRNLQPAIVGTRGFVVDRQPAINAMLRVSGCALLDGSEFSCFGAHGKTAGAVVGELPGNRLGSCAFIP